jgi:hypothetical protein
VRQSDFRRFALSTCVGAAMLAGCGGSQPPIGAGAMPQTRAIAQSWSDQMHGATSSDLIYATGACGGTCVLSSDGKLVGTLKVGDAGACADQSGNVYIADTNKLFEFAHGGRTPINTFTVSDGEINSCSVDAETGNIAAAVVQSNKYDVAIFLSPSSSPTTYLINFAIQYCGYDNAGNLFVDGYHSGYPATFEMYELPKSSSQFTNISVNPSIKLRPGQVQWDGDHMTVEVIGVQNGVTLYRLDISGSAATVVGRTRFRGVSRATSQSWIQGDRIFIPYGTRGNGPNKTKVGIWGYPAGGKILQKIGHFEKRPDVQGVTFSAG